MPLGCLRPIIENGLVLQVCDQQTVAFVLALKRSTGQLRWKTERPGAEWEVLAVNDLGEEIGATPALSEGRIYVRTRGAMYCFGAAR